MLHDFLKKGNLYVINIHYKKLVVIFKELNLFMELFLYLGF